MRRVFVDTSVLFPFSVMDLLLALTEDAVHQVLWTEDDASTLLDTVLAGCVAGGRCADPHVGRSITG